jgi:hypothetical protein
LPNVFVVVENEHKKIGDLYSAGDTGGTRSPDESKQTSLSLFILKALLCGPVVEYNTDGEVRKLIFCSR